MTRGVFFDLYGTIFPYGDMKSAWKAWLHNLHAVLVDNGLQQNVQAFGVCCKGFFGRPEPSNHDGLTLYEARIAEFCRELGLDPEPDIMRRAAAVSVRGWQEFVPLDRQAHDVLERLGSNRKLALISNFDHPPHVHELLAEHQLDRYFEQITVSADIGIKKPDPRIFAPALLATGLEPSEVVYVGDSPEDIEGARAAGITPILIRRDDQRDSNEALDYNAPANNESGSALDGIHIIRSLSELAEIL